MKGLGWGEGREGRSRVGAVQTGLVRSETG